MSMFAPLKPHSSHVMRPGPFNNGIKKCHFCGLTDLQDNVELPCGNADKDAEIDRLRSQVASIRASTIEECARIADAFAEVSARIDGGVKSTVAAGMWNVAASIRALSKGE